MQNRSRLDRRAGSLHTSANRAIAHIAVARRSQRGAAMHDMISVPAEPNGLAICNGALYLADDRSLAVMRVDGTRVTTIDSAGIAKPNHLGGLAAGPDGGFFVARLGWGTAGAVFHVDADGRAAAVDDLPARFWRLGVAYCADEHAVYTTQFLKCSEGATGSVARIDLATGELSVVAEGFTKPVGVAKLGTSVIVTDARQCAVFRIDGATVAPLARDIGRPDTVAIAGEDSVYVTTYDAATETGAVREIWLDGRVRTLASGAWEPRGVIAHAGVVYVALRHVERILVVHLPS